MLPVLPFLDANRVLKFSALPAWFQGLPSELQGVAYIVSGTMTLSFVVQWAKCYHRLGQLAHDADPAQNLDDSALRTPSIFALTGTYIFGILNVYYFRKSLGAVAWRRPTPICPTSLSSPHARASSRLLSRASTLRLSSSDL